MDGLRAVANRNKQYFRAITNFKVSCGFHSLFPILPLVETSSAARSSIKGIRLVEHVQTTGFTSTVRSLSSSMAIVLLRSTNTHMYICDCFILSTHAIGRKISWSASADIFTECHSLFVFLEIQIVQSQDMFTTRSKMEHKVASQNEEPSSEIGLLRLRMPRKRDGIGWQSNSQPQSTDFPWIYKRDPIGRTGSKTVLSRQLLSPHFSSDVGLAELRGGPVVFHQPSPSGSQTTGRSCAASTPSTKAATWPISLRTRQNITILCTDIW
jgi:hypothetical protein